MNRIHRLGRPLKNPVPRDEQLSLEPKAEPYHRYTDDAPLCKCGCGKRLYWSGELLTGYKLSCRARMREALVERIDDAKQSS